MPRSAAKSKADRHRSRSSVQVTPPAVQDLDVKYIIPHRLTQAQWMDTLIQEDTDEIVQEIMEELMKRVMDGCLKVYIDKQRAPFTASWAKSYLTQFLEQHIIRLDDGDGPEDASDTKDSEPMPVTPDVWIPGCVPVVNATPQPQHTTQQEVDIGQIPEHTEPKVNCQRKAVARTTISPKQSEKGPSLRRPVTNAQYKAPSPRTSPKVDPKKKQQIHLPPGPVPGKLLPPLSCSVDKRDVEVDSKKRTPSSSNHMTGSYQHKDYRPIPRLDPSLLPRHCITPQYEILDNNNTQLNSRKPSRLSKLEQKYRKQQPFLKPLTSPKDEPERFQTRNEADVRMKKLSPYRHSKEGLLFSQPLKWDTMELAKGVSLLDPQDVDIDSFKLNPPALSTNLRMIRSDPAVPPYSIKEVTAGPPPRVTPLFQSKN